MAEDNTQPIIVKKIKKGGHGHHGGAWKIAYADFVTAMMAFFLLMWLLGSTTKEQKQAISDYFNNPSPIMGPGGASTSMIKVGGGKDVTYSEGDTKRGSNEKDVAKEVQAQKSEVGQITQDDKQRLLDLKKELEKEIDASEALKPFKDQLLLEITKEGLRVQIIDKENRPMFSSGSAIMQPYAVGILKEIGKVINHVPNRISLSGHTDATPYSKFNNLYTNWELSADRANASRRALINGGMDEDKVARVVGLSSAVLFDKENPNNPINRRISIIVLNKETEDAILHDEGKLDQTTSDANKASNAQPAVPEAPSAAPQPQNNTSEPPSKPAQTSKPINSSSKAVPADAVAAAAAASAAASAAAKH
ncbi:chemotaxis protein MotB [Novimethylophilus kurashikiensis]|uniref:Chemotaxis protein MotB n=1 Tax=Novimethylophilus kurashikiensis TaxID=1825523 RepID=A0A2R5F7Z2_9PROT|nr:flagellar motor protein MotB [Novimethylophilus kurashikiensis]GBG13023.1 chemotaxis protein MotB [Novimethylophilus kurashikiensis]